MDADIVIEPIADSSPVVYVIVELCMAKYFWLWSFKMKQVTTEEYEPKITQT